MRYEVLLIPSSDEDREFAECNNFDEAMELLEKSDNVTHVHAQFHTEAEKRAYVEGYLAGIGYMGDGVHFVKEYAYEES